jgi:hypothetical protein
MVQVGISAQALPCDALFHVHDGNHMQFRIMDAVNDAVVSFVNFP